jgi:hypothetical protein
MTVVPDLVTAGVLTILVALALAVWALGFAHRRHGGAGLVVLSLLLLLAGGGFGPPLMGVVPGFVAARGRPARRPAGAVRARLAVRWRALLAVTVLAYLGLLPGTVLIEQHTDVDGAALMPALVAIAFAGFALTLTAAVAHDRATPADVGRRRATAVKV